MRDNLNRNSMGFWEIKNKPTEKELETYYSEKYYQEAKGNYEFEYTPEELHYIQIKLEQRLAAIEKHKVTKKGKLLDVGCGEGYNLAFFRKRGWNVKGIDFSSAGIKSKNPDCLDVLATGDICHLLNEEISSDNSYDLVWLQNVLEHVINPYELLKSLSALISKTGILVVTVPNDCSITQIAALKYHHIDTKFWIKTPDHLNYFNPESLCNLADKTNWKCLEMLGDFPIDWFLFHPESNYVRNKKAGKSAHKARIELETIIHQQPIDDVINLWSTFAKLGIGRNITALFVPKENRKQDID